MDNVEMNTFQQELKAFFKNLLKVFPEDKSLKFLSSSLNIALMDDPDNKVMYGFYVALSPFESYIDTRDERFFYEYASTEQPLLNKLSEYWETLDMDNRKVVWDYLQVLFLLSKREFVQKS